MDFIRVLMFTILIGVIFSVIAFIIAKFEKKSRLPKYIPAILLFLIGAACVVKSRWFSEGLEELGYIVIAILVFVACATTLIITIAIDIYQKHHRGSL
ncbi:MAG: hypothetical protein Q8942_19465 [Bacillota bacterium]|nr:hypothetical protein [Bacillota bacterium]